MPSIKNPKHIYITYVSAFDRATLVEVKKIAMVIFATRGLDMAIKNVTDDLIVISVTSDSPIESQLVGSFEARVGSKRCTDILFSYLSKKAVYLYSLILFYEFEENQEDLSRNFRRELAYAAYDLLVAEVVHFQQSIYSTFIVLCSPVRIPEEEIAAVLAKTNVKQITTTISFKSF